MSAIEKIHLENDDKRFERLATKIDDYFSELGQVEAAAVEPGGLKHFGVTILPLFEAPREIVKALIFTEKIQTYKKTSVDLELEFEDDNQRTYTAYFAATENIDGEKKDYKFGVKISKVTGEVDVIGI